MLCVKCGVWSVEWTVWGVDSQMWSVEWTVGSVAVAVRLTFLDALTSNGGEPTNQPNI